MPRQTPQRPPGPPPGQLRLQRLMADRGVASRRACEELIEQGRVAVNGKTVRKLPAFVNPGTDRVTVNGKPLLPPERRIYILLNKPGSTVTTSSDEWDRRTVLDLVDHPARARLFPVGRLDYDTRGLVLLTNDGELANLLTHPRYGVHKTYRAVVKGRLDEDAALRLGKGVYLAQRKHGKTLGAQRTTGVELAIVKHEHDRTTLDITLREGRNRQVRRMLVRVGFPVKRLTRIAMGPLKLKGVAVGQWRELTTSELRALRRAASPPSSGAASHASSPPSSGAAFHAASPPPPSPPPRRKSRKQQ